MGHSSGKMSFTKIKRAMEDITLYPDGRNPRKSDPAARGNSEHCNGYATQCCLHCDKCWGKKHIS